LHRYVQTLEALT
jgi:hypothetical protein